MLVWAADRVRAEALATAVAEHGRDVWVLEDDAALATAWRMAPQAVLVAEDGARLAQQQAFLRLPLILVRGPAVTTTQLARRAYASVRTDPEAALAVDRFVEHQRLAMAAARRREPPRHCSRCGRGYDPAKARAPGTARRFVKFGSVSLCGGCLEELRRLLHEAVTPFVEADRRA